MTDSNDPNENTLSPETEEDSGGIPFDFDADLLEPRYIAIAPREWMEPYHLWELEERQARISANLEHTPALTLWLRVVRLFRLALIKTFELDPDITTAEKADVRLRLDILTMAGISSKCVLDLLAAGYYTQAFGLIRHLIESWFQLLFLRYAPSDEAWRWLPNNLVPDEVLGQDGFPRKRKVPEYPEIRRLITDNGTDRDKKALSKFVRGFGTMSSHSHPSMEGLSQLFFPDFYGPRVMGPSYSEVHFKLGFKWGMAASLKCIEELSYFDPEREEWWAEYIELSSLFGGWLTENQASLTEMEEQSGAEGEGELLSEDAQGAE
jgi:hypothetical protein